MEELLMFLFAVAAVGIAIAAVIALGITAAALIAGSYAFVWLSRDLAVWLWPSWWGADAERIALLCWVSVVPAVGALLSCAIATLFVHEHWFLSFLCGLGFTWCYFWWYFNTSPKHYNWPRFVARASEDKFSRDLASIQRKFEFELWKISLTKRFSRWIDKRKDDASIASTLERQEMS